MKSKNEKNISNILKKKIGKNISRQKSGLRGENKNYFSYLEAKSKIFLSIKSGLKEQNENSISSILNKKTKKIFQEV